MYERLRAILIEDLRLNADEASPDASLDSLAVVELSIALTRRLGIDVTDDELLRLETVADIAAFIEGRMANV